MHKLSIVLLLTLTACASGPRMSPRGGTLYSDGQGFDVAVVEVDTDSGPRILVRFSGTASVLDGKVLVYRPEQQPDELVYVTTLDGDEFWAVHFRDFPRNSNAQVYLPEGSGKAIAVAKDTERSARLDLEEIVRAHREQLRDGSLQRLQAFDVAKAKAAIEAQIAEAGARYTERCGGKAQVLVDWDTFGEERLRRYSVGHNCAEALYAMATLCEHESARAAFAAAASLRCSFGAGMTLALVGNELRWTVGANDVNRDQFLRQTLTEGLAWPGEGSLAVRIERESSALCSDGKDRFAGLSPHPQRAWQVFFGDGKAFVRVPVEQGAGGDWFFEPREYNAKNNDNFWGVDLRNYSHLEVDRKKNTCVLYCGSRETPLQLLDVPSTMSRLAAATFGEGPARRRPYALARDRKGTYYFVDTGSEPDSKRYRLYSGPKGSLKELTMVNVVSDSQGDVFATSSGSLRLILEKEESFWVQNEKSEKLVNLPLHENWKVIYKELGVYTGQPYGTPCDIF